jgi:hypothetical protein
VNEPGWWPLRRSTHTSKYQLRVFIVFDGQFDDMDSGVFREFREIVLMCGVFNIKRYVTQWIPTPYGDSIKLFRAKAQTDTPVRRK